MTLPEAVRSASRPEIFTEVHALYADLAEEIRLRSPRCDVSGRCCHFDTYGHRLYVTTAELATFLRDLPPTPPSPHSARSLPLLTPTPSCPYLVDGLCSVHTIRPFGCRIFFCDPAATSWMEQTYEAFHARLKDLHTRLGVPYFYVEWRAALSELTRPEPAAEGP